jgi:Holliday junction resolvase-like predicted endonuclease
LIKNPKQKGSRNERKSRDWLLAEGALYVIKAGGSLGQFDLVAIGKGTVELVQVKTNRWPAPAEIEELIKTRDKIAEYKQFRISIHRWDDFAREPLVRYLL